MNVLTWERVLYIGIRCGLEIAMNQMRRPLKIYLKGGIDMKRFEKENYIISFSDRMRHHYTVDTGDTFMVETSDCYGGQIDSEDILISDIDRGTLNLSTGPFYVNGLTANDVLKLDIQDIQLDSQGVMVTRPGLGVLGDEVTESTTNILPITNDHIDFGGNVRVPIQPMIGVIGVAPVSGDVDCAVPGNHGGNLDTKEITTGNSIYLPVFQEGGLFALGDMHASMGDGELDGTGVEIGGRVVLSASKITEKTIQAPIVETDDSFMFLASTPTLEEATRLGSGITVSHLQQELNLDFETAYRILSAVCDVRISQVVNKLVTVKIVVPKTVLPTLFM